MIHKLTQEQKDYIKDYALIYTYESISTTLNISKEVVREYALSINISKNGKLKKEITTEGIKELLRQSKSSNEIAKYYGISYKTFLKYLSEKEMHLRDLNKEVVEDLIQEGFTDLEIIEKLGISSVALWNRKNFLKKNKRDLMTSQQIKERFLESLNLIKKYKLRFSNAKDIENKLNELLELIEKGA